MDTLRNVFGNTMATILRLALVVGTLAAAYFFLVKPALETTENISAGITNSINQGINGPNGFQQQLQRQIQQSVPNTVPQQRLPSQVQITRTIRGLSPQQSRRFAKCVQRAGGRIPAINRCFRRFSRK